MRPWKLTLSVVSLLITVSTDLPINLLVPFSVPQVLAQTVEERKAEADRILQQGIQQFQVSQFEAALDSWQQALAIYRQIKDRRGEGKALGNLGIAYLSLGSYLKAIEYQQQSLTIAQEIKDRQGEGNALVNLGNAYIQLGDYRKAIEFYQQSLAIAREMNDRQREGNALGGLGIAYTQLGDYPKAIEFYQQSLAIAREMNDRQREGNALGNLGNAYTKLGDYPKAIEFYQQYLIIAQEIKDRRGEGTALGNLGSAYLSLGNYPKAIEYQQQSLTIAQEIKDRQGEGKALGNLGSAYLSLGNYSQAIEYLQQHLAIAREIKDRQSEGTALGNLGSAYLFLRNYPKAIEYLQQDLAIAREIKDRQGEGNTLVNLGNAYLSLRNYPKAIEYFQQSLANAREINDRKMEGTALGNLGIVYAQLGDYPKAIKYFQQSLAIAQEINDRKMEGAVLGNLGNVYDSLGNYPKAINYHQQSLAIAKEIKDREGEATSLNNLGVTLYKQGNLTTAEATLISAIEVYESLRSGLNDANRVSIFEGQDRSYRTLQKVLIAQNKTDKALEISERGRGRAFVELLVQRLSTNQTGQTEIVQPTIQQIKQIAKSVNSTFVQYSIIYDEFKILDKEQSKESELYIWVIKPTGEIAFRKVDLKPLWQQQNTSLQELVTKNLELVSAGINRGESDNPALSNNPSFAPGDLVRLNNDRPNYPAWQVVSVNSQNRTLRLRQPSFAEGVTIERSIADATKVSSPNAQNKRLQQLHKLLIEPIADLLPTDPNARVIFIPQGALFFVPFPALQDADSKFLIEKHTILTAPSIQVLDLTHQQRQRVPGAIKDVLVVGNPTMPEVSPFPGEPARQLSPLPAAEREATEVAQMFKTQALIGNQATKTAILLQLPKARIIHLATHGLLDDYTGGGVPGAIALAPSPNDNGLLTASEILDLKLNAELVVLSACNTGKGRITGDGVIGLSRSLISAGVPSVVVSLWSVPDAPTASLMTEFYRQMQRSPDKAQALRQAMLTTIRTHPNPKDWAAFTLIGEAE